MMYSLVINALCLFLLFLNLESLLTKAAGQTFVEFTSPGTHNVTVPEGVDRFAAAAIVSFSNANFLFGYL